jgi:hypothetical protein
MASLKLDMTNHLESLAWEFPNESARQTRGFADYLFMLTEHLGILFDVDTMENTHEGPVIEFTGRPDALAILIRRYEEDPGLRAELRDRITYVAPMTGSCES